MHTVEDSSRTAMLLPTLTEEELENLCCRICLDVAVSPVRCRTCHSTFCYQCAIKWKGQHDSCPFKCHTPWIFDQEETLGPVLRCPFGKNCPMFSPQNLQTHLETCLGAPSQLRFQLKHRSSNACTLDHPLEFLSAPLNRKLMAQCKDCHQMKICQSVCRMCRQRYCTKCRPPPCTKSECPNGHPLIESRSKDQRCIICGFRASLLGTTVFQDVKCGIAVCMHCHAKLPEHTLVKPKINNFQECMHGHPIEFLKEGQIGHCSHCKLNTRIERHCPKCSQNYCLECKPLKILRNNRCLHGHEFKEGLQKQCTRCRHHLTCIHDAECGVWLCQECFLLLMDEALISDRIVGQFCSSGHRLRRNERKLNCDTCQKSKFCPLKCPYCNKGFCLKCRPSKYHMHDHSGHSYLEIHKKGDCVMCEQLVEKVWKCEICSISLCVECYQKS